MEVGADGHVVAGFKLIDQLVRWEELPLASHHRAWSGMESPDGGESAVSNAANSAGLMGLVYIHYQSPGAHYEQILVIVRNEQYYRCLIR